MISLAGLTKRFGKRVAVEALSMEVPSGSIFGLLGPNGAGKSTVIGMILGQVLADAGSARINGYDVLVDRPHALAKVGAIYETPAFYDYLSGERNLRIYGEYTARTDPARLKEIVHLVGLTERIRDRVAAYSHGMRQRLEGIFETRNLILKLHRDWKITILISSHQLSEMEQICTHLAVMHGGQLKFAGDWRHFAAKEQRIIIKVDRQAEAERGLSEAGLLTWVDGATGARLQPGITIPAVTHWLVQQGFNVERIAAEKMALEDFYLETIRSAGAEATQ